MSEHDPPPYAKAYDSLMVHDFRHVIIQMDGAAVLPKAVRDPDVARKAAAELMAYAMAVDTVSIRIPRDLARKIGIGFCGPEDRQALAEACRKALGANQ